MAHGCWFRLKAYQNSAKEEKEEKEEKGKGGKRKKEKRGFLGAL